MKAAIVKIAGVHLSTANYANLRAQPAKCSFKLKPRRSATSRRPGHQPSTAPCRCSIGIGSQTSARKSKTRL